MLSAAASRRSIVEVTALGKKFVGVNGKAPAPPDLFQLWLKQLRSETDKKLLRAVTGLGPAGALTNEAFGKAADLSTAGGAFLRARRKLKNLGLIDFDRSGVRWGEAVRKLY